jgi:hypothetical protein
MAFFGAVAKTDTNINGTCYVLDTGIKSCGPLDE